MPSSAVPARSPLSPTKTKPIPQEGAAPASKSRRAVRLPPREPDESSSDEEEVLAGPSSADLGGNGEAHRISPFAASDSSPTSRIPAQSKTKIHRSTASTSIIPTTSRVYSAPNPPTTASVSHPSLSLDHARQDWRARFQRSISAQTAPSIGSRRPEDKLDANPYWMSKLHPPDDDFGSDDEDDYENTHSPLTSMSNRATTEDGPPSVMVRPPAPPRSPSSTTEERERLEWQSMLASVLAGDVLQGESSRIGEERGGDETFKHELGRSLWWQIRAKLRGRSEDEERSRVDERRGRLVDTVLEEVERFVVKPSPGQAGVGRRLSSEDEQTNGTDSSEVSIAEEAQTKDAETAEKMAGASSQVTKPEDTKAEDKSEGVEAEGETSDDPETEKVREEELSALDQVSYILQKLNLVEGLYPHISDFRAEKPVYDSPHFQARVDALTSWSTVVYLLQAQLGALQAWTGSDELDITKPNTTKEKALVNKNRYHPLDAKARVTNDQAADDSTFLERIMKEDSLARTFSKRIFLDLAHLLANAKDTVIDHLPLFNELKLPNFQFELVQLIGFPAKLVIESLKVRLDAAKKLVEPNAMVINDMIDNFRQTISLAVAMKQSYMILVEPDEENHWQIPPCLPPEYDAVLLDGLRMFFRLLHYKLKSGSKTIYFRETDVLEGEMDFLSETAEAIPGGDVAVAEYLCSLTNKLMSRVCKYFDEQLLDPTTEHDDSVNLAEATGKSVPLIRRPVREAEAAQRMRRQMTTEEKLVWYGKILDAVRVRYRKLQRFARRLTNRYDNSSEYTYTENTIQPLLDQLVETDHFLVWDHRFADEGTYIIAPAALWEDLDGVRRLLRQVPTRSGQIARRRAHEVAEVIVDGENGEVEEEEPEPHYLLLLTPTGKFEWVGGIMAADLDFVEFALEENRLRLVVDTATATLSQVRRLLANLLLDEQGEPTVTLECLVEAQAHLPAIQRVLHKIAQSNYRLSESIIESATHVRRALSGAPGTQDMTEGWYQFASEHGRRATNHVDVSAHTRFMRLLMRLAISWCSFICDSCVHSDRKTFRWTVSALRMTLWVTEGPNILYLDAQEFSLLRRSVAQLIQLLIHHFDILGAKSMIEAKRETERLASQRMAQNQNDHVDDEFIPRPPSQLGHQPLPVDRSIRLMQEHRLQLVAELEAARQGFTSDQHLVGQVLDEQVSEDRALVFLAASSSNIALRWQQGAFIGGGANGNVYIGFNLDSGGIMAVKEIRVQDLSNSPALYKQIKDESDVMSMLSHPNIVEYFGIEVHRDRVFIFQEYCEGGSLANQLEHGKIEDEEVVIIYTIQMLHGLQYLHSKGIEHRDVKPENILLGTGSVLKFVDFGAAKVIAKGNKTLGKTRVMKTRNTADGPAAANSLAGTPMYMAPEVIRSVDNRRHLGAADIWSMGCVLLEITTGRKPWSNLDNEWAIMFHIGIATQAPPLPEHGELSELGIDFIERCLTLDPSDRPSATELLEHAWVTELLQHFDEAELGETLADTLDPATYAHLAHMEDTPSAELSAFATPDEEDYLQQQAHYQQAFEGHVESEVQEP